MSVKAHAWAKTVKTGSPTLKAVLVAIADYADQAGRAWPSQERLAEDTEFSVRAVRNAILALEEKGLLKREERRRADGTRGTDILMLSINRHEVPLDAEQPAPRSKQPAPHTDQPARGAGLTTFEPPQNHQQNRSDATASGRTGEPAEPLSVRDRLWFDGVLTLRGLGMTDPGARRLIGKLLRDTGGDAGRIHWAIDEARAAETGDPVPYVTRLLNDTPTARPQSRASPARRGTGNGFLDALLDDHGGSHDPGSSQHRADHGNVHRLAAGGRNAGR